MAHAGGVSRYSRSAPHRPGTRDSYGQVPSTTAPRDRPPALTGFLLCGCARARCPGTPDAIHSSRSRITPLVRASGCYQRRRGVLLDAPTAGALPGKLLSCGKEWSQGWDPESFCEDREPGEAKPEGRPSRPSFWVPLTEGRRWYALGGKVLASTDLRDNDLSFQNVRRKLVFVGGVPAVRAALRLTRSWFPRVLVEDRGRRRGTEASADRLAEFHCPLSRSTRAQPGSCQVAGEAGNPEGGGIGPPGRWVCWAPLQKIKNRDQHGTVSADILS